VTKIYIFHRNYLVDDLSYSSWFVGFGLSAVGKLSKNLLVSYNLFSSKNAKFKAETLLGENLGAKLKFLSTYNFLCWKFAGNHQLAAHAQRR